MNVQDLLLIATSPTSTASDDLDGDFLSMAFRVNENAASTIDQCAQYLRVSRATFLRTLLAEPLAESVRMCSSAGSNTAGKTFAQCRPHYLTDEEEQAYEQEQAYQDHMGRGVVR